MASDLVHSVLSLVPVPYLAPAWAALNFIWTNIQQVQASKEQLSTLAESIAQLLKTLDGAYSSGNLEKDKTTEALESLQSLLAEISSYVQKEVATSFLKLLFKKGDRIAKIDTYQRRINSSITIFQVSALIDITTWQKNNDNAKYVDQKALEDELKVLRADQRKLIRTLDIQQSNMVAMMVSIRRHLDDGVDGDQECQFFSHTLRYLTTMSGRQIGVEPWMVTAYEVEFVQEIGNGGFSRIYKGTWGKTEVALKVFTSAHGVTPDSKAVRGEVEVWLRLRHPNVLDFLGANVVDQNPFIVMPYMKNGNVRDYLENHPQFDRVKLLHEVSLGVFYLHSQNVVHGDIKAVNILIGDDERAVLCDFGLSRVKADTAMRTAIQTGGVATLGSRNWMAPELLQGHPLHEPSDIYAFGMVIYEVFAGEVPLINVDYATLVPLVVDRGVRPHRPDTQDHLLPNEVWGLAERCWAQVPVERPLADVVCDTLTALRNHPHVAPQTGQIRKPSNKLIPDVTPARLVAHTPEAPLAQPPPPDRKYILTMDGGGYRGLAALLVLDHLMEELAADMDHNTPPAPCEVFDLICGSSTGGLIAILLGRLGLDCREAIRVFQEICPAIFQKDDVRSVWGKILKSERPSAATFDEKLSRTVAKYTGDKDALMKIPRQSPDKVDHKSTDTFVTIRGLEDSAAEPYCIRSYASPRGGIDSPPEGHRWSLYEAARGVVAMPTYLAPLEIERQSFQDAESGYNNPVLIGMREAELRWSPAFEFMVISLGTGLRSLNSKPLKKKKSRLEEVVEQLVSVSTDTEHADFDAYKRFKSRGRAGDYFRFNPFNGLGDIGNADCTMGDAIKEMTWAWLSRRESLEMTSAAVAKLRIPYMANKSEDA